MVDSTILIDYFRKSDKSKSTLVKHSMHFDELYISCVTEFEIINGATPAQLDFWNNMLTGFTILDFDSKAARQSAAIVKQLNEGFPFLVQFKSRHFSLVNGFADGRSEAKA